MEPVAISVPLPARERQWHLATRNLFRFTFAYLVLYNLPFPLTLLSGLPLSFSLLGYPVAWYIEFWQWLVPWAGAQLFHLKDPITIFPNGSGDTTFNYVEVLLQVILAAAATIVWSLLDTRRRNYVRLHDWLRIYVRYSLAITMIGYGMHKVIKLQFI